MDPLQPHDIEHACSTYGVKITSEIDFDSDAQTWRFQGVNYKEAESQARDYIACREEGYAGIRIRQIRQRSN
jgi:hypothetical protein